VDFVKGRGVRKSLKLLKVEVKVLFSVFGHTSIKIMHKVNFERREGRQKNRFGHKKKL